jgi:glyoxylase-like metal-dependent hydrolase (beta-lactamase superfamily II)
MTVSAFRGSRSLAIAFAIVCNATVYTGDASASAPMIKKSGPAYYRVMLGDFEITVLSDGTRDQPMDTLLTGITKEAVDSILARSFQKSPYETSVNCFLVNTGTRLVLIDTGAGRLYGATLGNLLLNLRASGYKPEQIDEVYLTHMHVDHLGGLMNQTIRAFPNAILRADQAEADFWLSDINLANASSEEKTFFQYARDSVNPYVRAGKFKPFVGNAVLTSGISSKATHDHTAGHSIYIIESKAQKLEIWGFTSCIRGPDS